MQLNGNELIILELFIAFFSVIDCLLNMVDVRRKGHSFFFNM